VRRREAQGFVEALTSIRPSPRLRRSSSVTTRMVSIRSRCCHGQVQVTLGKRANREGLSSPAGIGVVARAVDGLRTAHRARTHEEAATGGAAFVSSRDSLCAAPGYD